MATNWTTLTGTKETAGSIKALVNYELIDSEGALEEAQAYIYGGLRVREMKMAASLTLTVGQATVALPGRFLELLKWRLPNGQFIEVKDESSFLRLIWTHENGELPDGDPTICAIYNEVLNLDYKPTTASVTTCLYVGMPAPLSALNETNFLCTRYPDILKAILRHYAYEQMEDAGEAAKWKQKGDELIAKANIAADLSLRGADYFTTTR